MKLTIEELNKLKPVEVLENEEVKTRFVSLYNNIHGKKEGEIFYEKEKYNLIRIINQSQDLQKCQGFSVYGTFLDLATMGLTLASNGGQPYLYVLSRNVNIGNESQKVWVKRMYTEVSPYGELSLRIAAGQILYADRPIVVYEGDVFQPGVNEKGLKYVSYSTKIPRTTKIIIGCFFKITRPDNSFDFFWMLPDDIERLKGYSLKQNSRGQNSTGSANALYSSNDGQIDPGFLEAKTIKHAFKTFPKIALGQFSKLQQTEEPVQAVDYGLDEAIHNETPDTTPFGDNNDLQEEPEGITVGLTLEDEGEW